MSINAPDLTKRPPRSPRVRLGGYAVLPRLLDKGRAELAGTNGEYNYNCPLDQRFTQFVGIDALALRQELAAGKGDLEILQWIHAHARNKHSPAEIEAWSKEQQQRKPEDAESQKYFADLLAKAAPDRKEITTWTELLDLDDYVSYGGKP